MGPLSISNEATRIYSTWFSLEPRGYCDRSLLELWESAWTRFGAERDECCEPPGSIEGVLELGSEVRSISAPMAGASCGDVSGRELCDICEGDLEDGNEASDGRRFGMDEDEGLE